MIIYRNVDRVGIWGLDYLRYALRSIVVEILIKYSQYKPSYGQVEIEQIFDRDHDSPVGDAPRTISITSAVGINKKESTALRFI